RHHIEGLGTAVNIDIPIVKGCGELGIVQIVRLENNLNGPILVGTSNQFPEVRREFIPNEWIIVALFQKLDLLKPRTNLAVAGDLSFKTIAVRCAEHLDLALREGFIEFPGDRVA